MRKIIIILLFALFVRLLFFMPVYSHFGQAEFIKNSGLSLGYYFQFAENLLSHHVFSLDSQSPYRLNTFHVPLYPVFIAAIFGLTRSLWFVLLIQVFLSVFVIYLLYYLAKNIFSEKIAIWSALFFSIEPYSVFQSFLLYSEVLFVFLFLLSVIFFWKFIEKNLFQYLFLSGVFLGFSVLTRAVSQFYLLFLLFFLIIIGLIKKYSPKTIFLGACILFSSVIFSISPWLLRNWQVYKSPSISYLGPYTFYLYNIGDFLAQQNKQFSSITGRDEQREKMRLIIKDKINDSNISAIEENVPFLIKYQSVFFQESFRIIKENSIDFLKFETIFTASFLLNDGYREILYNLGKNNFNSAHFLTGIFKPDNLQPFHFEENQNVFLNSFLFISEIFWLLVYAVIVLAFVVLIIKKSYFIWPVSFLTATILYFALATGSISSGRYHWPIVPFVILLFVFSLNYCLKSLSTRVKLEII